MLPHQLYAASSPYLEAQHAPDATLLNQLLTEQLRGLPDCVAVLHDSFVGYYHNGFLIASEPLTKYALPVHKEKDRFIDAQGRTIPLVPLVRSGFDCLVLSTLERVVDDEKAIVTCLSLYFSGASLEEAILN